jgi:uncharacterized peroxidase-related enzyme
MARIRGIDTSSAQGKVRDTLRDIEKAMGMLPNMLKSMAASPAALQAYLCMEKALSNGALTEAQRQAVYLTASQNNQCNYCLAAHTMLGEKAGLTEAEIQSIRGGRPSDSTLQALVDFTWAVIDTRGHVSDEQYRAFRQAGFGEAQVVEVLGAIAQATFTNYFNHVNQTELDFEPAASLER